MNRFFLDTNILVFIITNEKKINRKVAEILQDYSNLLYTSPVCIMEFIQLVTIGKITLPKKMKIDNITDVIEKDFYIKIQPFKKEHLNTLASLEKPHNDPFDHAIISHAITEKMTLISSDEDFKNYKKLSFIHNDI